MDKIGAQWLGKLGSPALLVLCVPFACSFVEYCLLWSVLSGQKPTGRWSNGDWRVGRQLGQASKAGHLDTRQPGNQVDIASRETRKRRQADRERTQPGDPT